MPLLESESIVLNSYNLSEADRIVVFFTRDHGVVRGVAKGAKRLKSRFGSTLELFSVVKLSFFQKDERELVSIQDVELVRSSFTSAANPEFLQSFSYLSELVIALVPPHDPDQTIYRMITACLQAANDDDSGLSAIKLYFELWLLRLGGYLPDWSRCTDCNIEFVASSPAFLRHDMHLICDSCIASRRMPAVTSVQRRIFADVQRLRPAVFIESAKGFSEAVADLSELMRRIIVEVVGRDIASRPAAAGS